AFFFSSRRRHTRFSRDWSSDVCSSDLSLGDSADVDFGDLLDYLGSDPHTRAILLYIESVKHARKFMSAARAAARNKPVVLVKSRSEERRVGKEWRSRRSAEQ